MRSTRLVRGGRTLLLVVALSMVAAACSSSKSTSTTSGQSGSTTTAAPAINTAAELKVGFTDDQYVTDGVDANVGAYPLNTNITETLTKMSANYEVQPGLADSWELRPPNTWRFHLHHGVTFQDGQPFNAQAVKTGLFDRLAKRTGGSTVKAGPDSAVVVDDYTIDFTPTVPNLRVPEQLVHPQNGVTAPGTDFTSKPVVGTGPFKYVSYSAKESIVVARNDNYWGTKANVAKITFRFYPDAGSRLLALKAGDIDLMFDISRDDVAGLKTAGFTVINGPVGAYRGLFLNENSDILKDVNVRKAIGMGIDRNSLISGVMDGLAAPDQTFVPASALGQYASLVKGYTYDLNGAKTALDNAGWKVGSDGIRVKDGNRMQLTLVSGFPSADAVRPTPTFLQSQLKNLGIDLKITEVPDSNTYGDLMKKKQGDMFLEEGNQNDANVGFLPILLLYTGPGSSGSGSYQGISAPGATFDSLLAPALAEPDHTKLQQEVASAMNEAVTNQATVLPLAGIYRIWAMKKTVVGFTPPPVFLHVSWLGVGVTK